MARDQFHPGMQLSILGIVQASQRPTKRKVENDIHGRTREPWHQIDRLLSLMIAESINQDIYVGCDERLLSRQSPIRKCVGHDPSQASVIFITCCDLGHETMSRSRSRNPNCFEDRFMLTMTGTVFIDCEYQVGSFSNPL